MAKPVAIAFDAYGTLLDVASLASELANPEGAERQRFVALWRSKQLEYTWLRTLMGKFVDFESVSGDALRYAMKSMSIGNKEFDSLMDGLRKIRCFPEVQAALAGLKSKVPRLAILSNGTPGMLASALEANGIQGSFETVLSVDTVKRYKPDPQVYAMATKHFGAKPRELLFVSSNSWDICGAASCGFTTAWCNRSRGIFDELGFSPDIEVRSLDELAGKIDLAMA
jgi:2-haloacid dehalogenase